MRRVDGGRAARKPAMLLRVLAGAAALMLAGCASAASPVKQARASSTTAAPVTMPSARVVTYLDQPSALAMGPDGHLYVADDGLNEILQLLPGGRFAVIAGTGKAGYSGDGGPAIDASLNDPGGMIFSRSGTLYFADTGNNRIRAVSPSGVISTVVGNGRMGGWLPGGTAAYKASLIGPADVVIGPGGTLYVADTGANEILKMTGAGKLRLVAGTRSVFAGVWGVGHRATNASPDGPDGLAFDRSGDLFIAGHNTKNLLMITPGGVMTLPDGTDGFYPRGGGGLVTAPNGNVLAMNTQQIDRLTPHGIRVIYTLPTHPRVAIQGFLPNGIAVAANGTLYLDTSSGNGWTSKTALIEIQPHGIVRVLWES
jgi:glucose/arabinose dehydrogenase